MPDLVYPDSRICGAAHIDGAVVIGAEQLAKDSANLVLTRNAVGSWSLNRTAAGAETYNLRAAFPLLARLGETLDAGEIGTFPSLGSKGVRIKDAFLIYQVGVVNLTSATLRIGKTVFADGVALAQTDLKAATAIAVAVGANPAVKSVAVAAPAFTVDDNTILEVEAVLVMANTGTLKVWGIGMHLDFNYT